MKKFIKFLEDNNARENFERNFENFERNFENSEQHVEKYKEMVGEYPKLALLYAFRWQTTREGFDYWDELNANWIREQHTT